MKKLMLALCLVLLLCSCSNGITRIGTDRVNWDQSLPIGSNLTMNEGFLVDAKLGSSSPVITVGPYKWCDFNNLTSACDYLGDDGGTIRLTAGNFTISNLYVPQNIHIIGNVPPKFAWNTNIPKNYTTIIITDTVNPCICPGSANIYENLLFYYPNQVRNSTPISYPATFQFVEWRGNDVTIKNCQAVNPYIFVNASTGHAGLIIENVVGYPIKYGIIEDNCVDISSFRGIYFAPRYNWLAGDNLKKWVAYNGYAMYIKRSDASMMYNCMSWGYYCGLYLDGNSGFRVLNSHFEDIIGIKLNDVITVMINGNYIYTIDAYTETFNSTSVGIVGYGSGSDSSITCNTIFSGGNAIEIRGLSSINIIGNNINFNMANSSSQVYGIFSDYYETGNNIISNSINAYNKNTDSVGICIVGNENDVLSNDIRNCIYGIILQTDANFIAVSNNVIRNCNNNITDYGSGNSIVGNIYL
jgi:hypothetical protein